MPKIRYTHPKGLVQETGTGIYLGLSGTTTRAAGTSELLSAGDAPVLLCDSTDNAHKVKLPLAGAAGQLLFVLNVDASQDVVVRNNADGATVATIGEGIGLTLVSTAAGDNWIPVGLGS